jgi:hypothetical protein
MCHCVVWQMSVSSPVGLWFHEIAGAVNEDPANSFAYSPDCRSSEAIAEDRAQTIRLCAVIFKLEATVYYTPSESGHPSAYRRQPLLCDASVEGFMVKSTGLMTCGNVLLFDISVCVLISTGFS